MQLIQNMMTRQIQNVLVMGYPIVCNSECELSSPCVYLYIDKMIP